MRTSSPLKLEETSEASHSGRVLPEPDGCTHGTLICEKPEGSLGLRSPEDLVEMEDGIERTLARTLRTGYVFMTVKVSFLLGKVSLGTAERHIGSCGTHSTDGSVEAFVYEL